MKWPLLLVTTLLTQIAVAQTSPTELKASRPSPAQAKQMSQALQQMLAEQKERQQIGSGSIKGAVVNGAKLSNKRMAKLSAQLAQKPSTKAKLNPKTPLLPQGRAAQSKKSKKSGL